jgi:CDGSH-type Zn-finger protein
MSDLPLASVTLCPDGPLLIRGDYLLLNPDGKPFDGHRNAVALCRCGQSAIKPVCDGARRGR